MNFSKYPLLALLSASEGGWVPLLPPNAFLHGNDELQFSEEDRAEAVKNFKANALGTDLPIAVHNAGHVIDTPRQAGAPAAGWIRDVKDEGGWLWIKPEWTSLGLSLLQDQLYKYISAEAAMNWMNPVSRKKHKFILRGALLTNYPAVKQGPGRNTALPLQATLQLTETGEAKLAQGQAVDLLKQIQGMLAESLSGEIDEAQAQEILGQIVAACEGYAPEELTTETMSVPNAQMAGGCPNCGYGKEPVQNCPFCGMSATT